MILRLGVQWKNELNATIANGCGAVAERSADTVDKRVSIWQHGGWPTPQRGGVFMPEGMQRCDCHEGHDFSFQVCGMRRADIRALDRALEDSSRVLGVSLLCTQGIREKDVKIRERGRQWEDEHGEGWEAQEYIKGECGMRERLWGWSPCEAVTKDAMDGGQVGQASELLCRSEAPGSRSHLLCWWSRKIYSAHQTLITLRFTDRIPMGSMALGSLGQLELFKFNFLDIWKAPILSDWRIKRSHSDLNYSTSLLCYNMLRPFTFMLGNSLWGADTGFCGGNFFWGSSAVLNSFSQSVHSIICWNSDCHFYRPTLLEK